MQLDESCFGKRKYNRGHRVEGVWVLGMVERTAARRVVYLPVPDRSAATLTNIIRKYVKPGSIIYTDCWRGYNNLKQYYTHYTVIIVPLLLVFKRRWLSIRTPLRGIGRLSKSSYRTDGEPLTKFTSLLQLKYAKKIII